MRAPNLACLERGALGQLAAGDPGRKAEVVLDPRGGAGLAAERDRVDRPACRGPPRRRTRPPARPAGPRADDHQVAHRGRGAARAEPEQPRDLGVATGCAARRRRRSPPASRRHRSPSACSSASASSSSSRSIHWYGIRLRARNSRRRRVSLRVARADQLHARADVDQDRAAREVGAQDDVAQLLVVGEQCSQPLGRAPGSPRRRRGRPRTGTAASRSAG